MSNDELNYAIQLLQQGLNEQAQPILQTLIRANQQDMVAWSWYVKSCRTPEKRLEALELCLRFNPGNPKIIHAIHVLREKVLEEQIFDFTPEPQPSTRPVPVQQPYPYAVVVVPETVQYTEPTTRQPARFGITDREVSRAFAWYDVWWMAMSQPNMLSYTALLRDANANPGRGYWWVFWASLIVQFIYETGFYAVMHSTTLAFQLQSIARLSARAGSPALQHILDADTSGRLMLIAAILSVVFIPFSGVFNVCWLIFWSALDNFFAKLYGGVGSFNRTVYLISAFTAPLTIVGNMLSWVGSLFPLGLFCISIFWLIYILRLYISAVQAAHQLNGMRSMLAVLTPVIAVVVFACLAELPVASQVAQIMKMFPRPY